MLLVVSASLDMNCECNLSYFSQNADGVHPQTTYYMIKVQ